MQNRLGLSWRRGGLLTGLLTIALLMVVSLDMATPLQAQGPSPTATPTDPSWLAFSVARTAVEEQESVDLTIVRNWEFFQDDWQNPAVNRDDNAAGIDSCDSDVHIADARPIFFGWTVRITDINGKTYEARVSFDLEDVAVCDEVTVVAPPVEDDAGDGEAVTDADLPQPVAGSGASGGFELGGHVEGLTTEAINAMKSSGMVWVKKQLPMSAGVGKGQEFIDAAHANGFKILLGVVGDKNQLASNFDGYVSEFSSFVGQLAAAGADAIEVWNEPNIDREWPVGQINGANYVRLLAPAYNSIKTNNSNTIVISGAPAPTGFAGAAGCLDILCNDDVFMQQMADAGASQYMDCVGLHYNEGIVSPGTTSGDPRGEYPTYYFGSMLNRGYAPFGGKPVCFTELGYLSAEGMGSPLPGNFGWAADTSVAEHAAWLADAASRAASSGKVRLMIIWNVNFSRWDTDPMGGYAMIRPDTSCPACSTLGAVMGGG